MAITSRALAFASRWFDAATVQRIFEPLIADWQREWQDASPADRARVSMHGLAAFICAVVISLPQQMARDKAPAAVTDRVAARIARFTLLTSALLFMLSAFEMDPAWIMNINILFLVPGFLTVAFPLALISAVDTIRSESSLSPRLQRTTAAKLSLLAMTLMLLFTGVVVPSANQAWRVAMNPDPKIEPAKGVRELTTWELIAHPERVTAAEHPRGVGKASRAPAALADAVRREINGRASLILLPVVFVWRRWSALTVAPGRWFSPLPSWLATTGMLFGLMALRYNDWFTEQALDLPAGGAAWLPLLILTTAGVLRSTLTRQPWRDTSATHEA